MLYLFINSLDYGVSIIEYLFVSEAKDDESLFSKELAADGILLLLLRFIVVGSIHFYDEI